MSIIKDIYCQTLSPSPTPSGPSPSFAGPIGRVTVRTAGNVMLPKKSSTTHCDIKGGVKDALALSPIKFFELSSLGIEVGPSKDGVRVTAAAAGKPFARAGLAVGDVLV